MPESKFQMCPEEGKFLLLEISKYLPHFQECSSSLVYCPDGCVHPLFSDRCLLHRPLSSSIPHPSLRHHRYRLWFEFPCFIIYFISRFPCCCSPVFPYSKSVIAGLDSAVWERLSATAFHSGNIIHISK